MRFNLKLIALLLFGFAFLIACNDAAKTVKKEQAKTNTNIAPQADNHDPADDAPRITLAEAKKDFDDGKAIFVDTRGEGSFKNDHIKGVMNMPVEFAETRYKEIPTDKKIIVYCSWPSEHSSAGLVTKLKEKGITNAFAMIGGTKAWKDAGYPMESK